jgi:hypothetical protein
MAEGKNSNQLPHPTSIFGSRFPIFFLEFFSLSHLTPPEAFLLFIRIILRLLIIFALKTIIVELSFDKLSDTFFSRGFGGSTFGGAIDTKLELS